MSPAVHALPSLQLAVLLVKTQPVAALQLSFVHPLLSLQTIAVPVHVPALQLSPEVQTVPSLQAVPLGAFGFEHTPVAGLHTPARWHASLAVQVTGVELLHEPARQLSN